jgi:Rieske Fe-S protein
MSADIPNGSGSTRRGFLNWFLGTSFGAAAVAIFYPVLRYVNPPEIPEATVSRVLAARVDEIPLNSAKVFKFGSAPGILVRTAEGEFRAFTATCTHLDCTVQYRGDMTQIWCACHNGFYDLTGKNVSGPPPRPLENFVVKVLGDEVFVSRKV